MSWKVRSPGILVFRAPSLNYLLDSDCNRIRHYGRIHPIIGVRRALHIPKMPSYRKCGDRERPHHCGEKADQVGNQQNDKFEQGHEPALRIDLSHRFEQIHRHIE